MREYDDPSLSLDVEGQSEYQCSYLLNFDMSPDTTIVKKPYYYFSSLFDMSVLNYGRISYYTDDSVVVH